MRSGAELVQFLRIYPPTFAWAKDEYKIDGTPRKTMAQ